MCIPLHHDFSRNPYRCSTERRLEYTVIITSPTSKGKAIPGQVWTGPEGSRSSKLPASLDNLQMKVLRLSAPMNGRFQPPENIPRTHFCFGKSPIQGKNAAGSMTSIKNSNPQSGIEATTFRLVSQCLNQLCHQQLKPSFFSSEDVCKLFLRNIGITQWR
jgi:hypothetical protein